MTAKKTAEQAHATRAALKQAGGLEAVSAQTGISTTQLSRYQSENEKDSIPLHLIEVLEANAGARGPEIIRHLASQAGYILVPAPIADRGSGTSLKDHILQEMVLGDEVRFRIFAALLLRNGISRVEALSLAKQVRLKLEATASILAELEAIAGDGQ